MFEIYKITNKTNGKIYIGQTKQGMKERIRNHLRCKNSLVGLDMNAIGIDKFSIEIIERVETQEESYDREIYWIKSYNCVVPNGYNQCYGGIATTGYHHSSEAKKIMSQRKSDVFGEKNSFYGKHHTADTKKRMSEAKKGIDTTKAWKASLAKSRKRVMNVDTQEVFPSMTAAAQKYNTAVTNISMACRIKTRTAGKQHWAYV